MENGKGWKTCLTTVQFGPAETGTGSDCVEDSDSVSDSAEDMERTAGMVQY